MKKLISNYVYLPRLAEGKKSALDYGCGRGDLLVELKKIIPNSVGCDIVDFIYDNSPSLVQGLKVDQDIFKVRESGTSFEPGQFDCIISNQVLEHVFDHEKILIEMD